MKCGKALKIKYYEIQDDTGQTMPMSMKIPGG